MALSRRLRFEILRRDRYTCRYCGASAPDAKLTVDHVIPVTLGGGDEPNNLVTACADCNAGKSSMPADAALVEDVDAAAMLFARAMERAAAIRADEAGELQADVDWWRTEYWDKWTYEKADGTRGAIPLPQDWQTSIERFLTLGLTVQELHPFVQKAMTQNGVRDEFRLFCKYAWNEIRDRQELARILLEDDGV